MRQPGDLFPPKSDFSKIVRGSVRAQIPVGLRKSRMSLDAVVERVEFVRGDEAQGVGDANQSADRISGVFDRPTK